MTPRPTVEAVAKDLVAPDVDWPLVEEEEELPELPELELPDDELPDEELPLDPDLPVEAAPAALILEVN